MELQEKVPVPIFTEVDKAVFLREVYPERSPAVLRGVCLGPCLEKWTVEYLGQRGGDKEVKIHVSTVPKMDFLHKNFVYSPWHYVKAHVTQREIVQGEERGMKWNALQPKLSWIHQQLTLPFNEFVRRASEKKHSDFFLCEDESYYLRSLGEDVRKEPADLCKQFPDLAEDFHMPQFFEPDQFFSSVFRISSCGLQLWTHYDVMDNLLAQVTGRKRVALYSPQDALHLYLSGDKSEVLDIDSPDLNQFPEFVKAKRYECVLEPGDLLFIPALWFHNTLALQFGVGVNVFWRHLPADSYDRKDPYGNKDPVAATRALQALERALHTLDELPADYRDFYGRRMIQRIQQRMCCDNFLSRTPQDSTLASSQFTKPG